MDEDDLRPQVTAPPLEPDDFYLEGSNLVFTAAYHRKRGYCCGSGCRHCPYREEEPGKAETSSTEEPC